MKLVVKSPVWDDLREIGLRFAKNNPNAAERFFIAAKTAFDLVSDIRASGGCAAFRCLECDLGPCQTSRTISFSICQGPLTFRFWRCFTARATCRALWKRGSIKNQLVLD